MQIMEEKQLNIPYYPFNLSISSTLIVPDNRKYVTIIANPIAASAAATVKINNVNTRPDKSPRNNEKETKLMYTASKISSILIKMTIFFSFKKYQQHQW